VGEFLSRPATGIWLATPLERPAKPKIENRSLNAPGGIKAQRFWFKPIHRPRRGVDVSNHFVIRIKSNAEQHLRQPASLASLLTGKEGYSAPVVNAACGAQTPSRRTPTKPKAPGNRHLWLFSVAPAIVGHCAGGFENST
jgi:hypothetical protein